MVQDAKIVAIEPAQVTIEWDGKTTVLRPIDAAMASPGGAERTPPRTSGTQRGSPSMVTVGATSQGQFPGNIQGQDGGAMRGELQNMRSTLQDMSSAERERLMNEMMGRFGGARGGMAGDRGGRTGGGGRGGRGGGGRGGR